MPTIIIARSTTIRRRCPGPISAKTRLVVSIELIVSTQLARSTTLRAHKSCTNEAALSAHFVKKRDRQSEDRTQEQTKAHHDHGPRAHLPLRRHRGIYDRERVFLACVREHEFLHLGFDQV